MLKRAPFGALGQPRLLLWAVGVGLLAGGAAALFRFLASRLPRLIWSSELNLMHAVALSPWWERLLVPVVGSLLAGLVLMWGARWAAPARGWDILEAVVVRDGVLHVRPALVKSISSLLTVASAGAIGREGPMVLLSATVASWGGRRFGLPTRQLRTVVGCGVAAGIACAYNTPIGAALFTMEIILGDFGLEVFAPLVFSSVVATLVSRAFFGGFPVFRIPEFSLGSAWEFFPFIMLGLLGGATAAGLLMMLRWWSAVFRRSRLPIPLAMGVVGLALGLIILRVPQVVGNGRDAIRDLFAGDWSAGYSLLLFGLRLVLTPATVGSGAAGGIFTPTLFLGAMLGDALGKALRQMVPSLGTAPKAYALIGMGSLLAGTTHAPLTSVIMLFEMTLDYSLVIPMLLAAATASVLARGLTPESVYTEALRRKRRGGADAPEGAVLRSLTVSDVMRRDQATVPADMPIGRLLGSFIAARRNHLYVVDDEVRLVGVVSLHDVHGALQESGANQTARELANAQFSVVTPREHLDRVLERFWAEESERIPVVDGRDSRRLLGTISQRDILGVVSLEALHRNIPLARFQGTGESAEPRFIELPSDHAVEEVPLPPSLSGCRLAETRIRERFGLTVLLVVRRDAGGKEDRLIPEGNTRLESGDHLVVFGPRARLAELAVAPAPPVAVPPS